MPIENEIPENLNKNLENGLDIEAEKGFEVMPNKNDDILKKVALILVVLVVVGGFYIVNIKTQAKVSDKPTNKEIPVAKKVTKKVSKVAIKVQKPQKAIKKVNFNKISSKPSERSMLIKQAILNSGKNDPFMNSIATANNRSSLPLPPSADGDTWFNKDTSKNTLQNSNERLIELKGFIGDKAIITINGATEALKKDEEFRGVKAISINPKDLTAKFIKNGETIIKTIAVPNNKDFKIITKPNKIDINYVMNK